MTAYSILDLAPVPEGSTPADALANSVDLAQHAEQWGYTRYWFAEHHNSTGIASAATSIMIGHVAGKTNTIRVGAGGIMLPNHAPLMVAEQFGTLATLYPDRIDLGLGRAPGTDMATARALRRIDNLRRQRPSGDRVRGLVIALEFPQCVRQCAARAHQQPRRCGHRPTRPSARREH